MADRMSFEQGRESLDAPTTPKSTKTLPVSEMPATTTPRSVVGVHSDTNTTDHRARLDKVLHSNIGINTLLTRLKQSISSAREFSTFLRERAILEEKHANGLKKLTRSTQELVRRPENRQGSFGQSYEEMTRIQDRMADNGMEFAQNLHMMAEELQDLAAGSERGRKEWKHKGLDAEQRATDAELTMEKAKARYFSLAEQYDRARTGERQGKSFGLKGPKSAAQQEEALLSKVQNADAEYSDRVQAARSQRQELISSSRPQALRELQNSIMECDAGLGMQLQKFALLNEKLLLHNGLSVSPLKNQTEGSTMGPRSLRDLAHHVNNQQDFDNYVLGHTSHVGPTPAEIQYEKHPAMMPSTQQSVQQPLQQPYGGGQPVAASTASIMGALDKRDTRNRSESGTLDRRDTDASLFNGPATSSGSTFAASQSQMQSQPSAQGGVYTPNQTSSTTAPQLPQIGALSMGGASGLGSSIPGSSTTLGSETDRRNFSGPQQHRPGQPSFSGPTQTSQYNAGPGISPGVGAQRDHYNTGSNPSRDPYNTGAAPSHDPYSTVSTSQRDPYGPGNGSGRGQPLTGNNNNAYTIGHSHTPSSQLPHSSEGRNQSYGQAGDFRSDGPSLPAGSAYQTPRTDNKYSPTQPGFQSQYTEGRGGLLPSSSYQSQQPEGRGMPTQSNYLYQQQNGRGQPIQSESYRSTGTSSSGNNGSTYGPSSNNNHGSPSTVAGAPPVPGHRMPSSNVSSVPSVRTSSSRTNLPPLKPVFGVSLDDLFRRDGGAVPPIVYQCVQAVDLYGLNTEGIYRTSGSAQHIMELRALFDHDSSQVDFRDPNAFHNDIAAVTTLLKHFLRDLKDPLLTSAQYNAFIQAAKIDDDIIRRDSLHAIINSLPDPNYATLRTLTLHLNRVSQHSAQNRMTANNLAIVFGPTLMVGQVGSGHGEEIGDSGYQARVIETILHNTYQIFDDDD